MKKNVKPREVIYKVAIHYETPSEAETQCKSFNMPTSQLKYDIDSVVLEYGVWAGPEDGELAMIRFIEEKYSNYKGLYIHPRTDYCIGAVTKRVDLYSESGELWSTIREVIRIRLDPKSFSP